MLFRSIIITPRLMPGLHIGDAFISIEYGRDRGHRQHYRYYIDIGGREYTDDDLSSGCNHSLQNGLESLLSFLGACVEGRRYARTGRESENADLFPDWVGEWAEANSDEISMVACELEETEGLIVE